MKAPAVFLLAWLYMSAWQGFQSTYAIIIGAIWFVLFLGSGHTEKSKP